MIYNEAQTTIHQERFDNSSFFADSSCSVGFFSNSYRHSSVKGITSMHKIWFGKRIGNAVCRRMCVFACFMSVYMYNSGIERIYSKGFREIELGAPARSVTRGYR